MRKEGCDPQMRDGVLHAPLWSLAGSKSAKELPQTKHCEDLWSLKACGRCMQNSWATVSLLLPGQAKKQTLCSANRCGSELTFADAFSYFHEQASEI
ncbi:hypothetical protein ILYODFUR_002144 [Ilyodon furcidens]|uniref:Uncharacterized protein n=1 Tax=Ilyodon furcidens TaxID=33524 RepID=A0ABV0SI60_9TELE